MTDRNYRVHRDAKFVEVDLDEEEIYFRGERLTEERAEQIAEEALAAARAKNLIPGGKSLSGKGDHSPAIHVRVPAQVRRELSERAGRKGVSVSKLVRGYIEDALSRDAA